MIRILKTKDIQTLRHKLIVIYLLNVTDIIFTHLLLNTRMFRELNIFMQPIVKNIWISLIVKVIFPALITVYLIFHLSQLKENELGVCNFFINLTMICYLCVNILHVAYGLYYQLAM